MIHYRTFKNTDPPAIVQVWNKALTGRGAVQLPGSLLLEQQVFAKPFFDREGLILAEEDGQVVGFGHAGFGPDLPQEQLSPKAGIICMLAVIPSNQRHGVGAELLKRCEEYLQKRGAQQIFAGSAYPLDPFYLGIYGGSALPGVLASDQQAGNFFLQHGYEEYATTLVFQRIVQRPLRMSDPRFMTLRKDCEIIADEAGAQPTWWQNSVLGMIEPLELTLVEKKTGKGLASAMITDLGVYRATWNQLGVGVTNFLVQPEARRKGIGKFFLTQIIRFLQEQCFSLVEIQVNETNEAGIALCHQLEFDQVDTGKVYQKKG